MSDANITPEKVLIDLEYDKVQARKKSQYSVACNCSIAQGKYLAMFTDNVAIDIPAMRDFEQREQQEAKTIAATIIKQRQKQLTTSSVSDDNKEDIAEQGIEELIDSSPITEPSGPIAKDKD